MHNHGSNGWDGANDKDSVISQPHHRPQDIDVLDQSKCCTVKLTAPRTLLTARLDCIEP
jgi:hypothetical protein